MKFIRAQQLLAAVLTFALAIPAGAVPVSSVPSSSGKSSRVDSTKAAPEVVGIVISGQKAVARDTSAPPGTTIYSGDTLKTFKGHAAVAIGDSQVRLGAESRARLLRARGRVQLEIERGRVNWRNSWSSPVEARLADATITGSDAAIAGIAMLSETKAVVAAERGTLKLTTARDNKSMTLRAGESVEVTLANQDSDESDRRRRGGGVLLSSRKVAIFGAVLITAISLIGWSIQDDSKSSVVISPSIP